MKGLRVVLASGLITAFLSTVSFAQHMHKGHHYAEAEEAKEGLAEAGNKICPVSAEEIIEGEAFKSEYEGKIYNLCCKMCAKDFKKNPQKYIEKLEEEEHHEGHHHEH